MSSYTEWLKEKFKYGLRGHAIEHAEMGLMLSIPASYSTAQAQTVLTAVAAAGGGEVVAGPGVFVCSNTLSVPSNVHFRGAGRGTTIFRGIAGAYAGTVISGATVYATIAMVDSANASVRGITVDHATNGTEANGIVALAGGATGNGPGCRNCVIEDNEVLGHNSHQYLIWERKGNGIKILNNWIDGGVSTYDAASEQEGIECYGGTDVLVQGNTANNVGGNAYYCNPDVAISGPANNIRWIGNFAYKCRRMLTVGGIETNDLLADGNQGDTLWENGIVVTAGATGTRRNTKLVRNSVRTAPVGIRLYADSGAVLSGTSVDDNTISSVTPATDEAAIFCVGFADVSVTNNKVYTSSQHGIYFSTSSDVVVTGNKVLDTQKHGIYFYTVTGLVANSNRVFNFNGAIGAYYGIYAASCSKGMVDFNEFSFVNRNTLVRTASCDLMTIGNSNRSLIAPNGAPTIYDDASTNPNKGTFTLTASSTSKAINNTQLSISSFVNLQQTAGTPCIPTLAIAAGSFTLTFAAAVGDETFSYWI